MNLFLLLLCCIYEEETSRRLYIELISRGGEVSSRFVEGESGRGSREEYSYETANSTVPRFARANSDLRA